MVNIVRPKRVLGFDISILDYIFKHTDCPSLQTKFGYKPGDKAEIDLEAAHVFRQRLNDDHVPLVAGPGGSTSNAFRVKSKLLGKNNTDLTFVTALGKEPHADRIREAQKADGIKLITQPDDVNVVTAFSFVPTFPDGDRATNTYRGNAREVINVDMFPKELVETMDGLFIQGSAAAKFASNNGYHGESGSELLDHLLTFRKEFGLQLTLALPTTAFQPKYFEYLVCSADVVLSNVKELGFLFEIELDEEPASDDHAFIPKTMHRNQQVKLILDKFEELQKKSTPVLEELGRPKQVAFITDGGNGSYVIRDGQPMDHVPAQPFKRSKDGCSLGCGDTFAGAVSAYLEVDDSLGCNVRAATFANVVAAANMRNPLAVLDDPLTEASKLSPTIVDKFVRRRDAKFPPAQVIEL